MTQWEYSRHYLRGKIRKQIRADLMKFLIKGCSEDSELLKETKKG